MRSGADDLALLALRYAAGDLPAGDAAAFEARLATDPAAQDALAEAVRLSAKAAGQPVPAPDPLTRQAVAERLREPAGLRRLTFAAFRRRPYRGHPLTWAAAGAAATAAVVGVGVWLGDVPRPAPSAGPPVFVATPPAAATPPTRAADATPAGGSGVDRQPPNPMTTFLPSAPPAGLPETENG